MMVWDLRDAHWVLSRWAPWAVEAPDAVTTSYRHLQYPPIPEIPEPFRGRQLVIIDGAVAAIDRLVEVSGVDSGSSLFLAAELRQLGGALGRPQPGAGAVASLDGQFQLITGGLMVGELAERTVADCERVVDALAPYSRGRQYLNFQEEPVDPSTGFDATTWAALQRIRQATDPTGLFQANHEIPPR
jgi:hypothetical protein